MAKGPKRPEELSIVSVDGERERTIALLSQHFAQDNLSLDELERRIELAYRAASLSTLHEITRDLTEPASEVAERRAVAVPEAFAPERDRIIAVMSETTRRGVWRPARHLDVWSVMAETTLDLTQAVLPPGVTEIHVNSLMSKVKVIVPPGVRVVLQPTAFMATVSDETMEPPAVGSGAPVIRVTGTLVMAEFVARVRTREQSVDDD